MAKRDRIFHGFKKAATEEQWARGYKSGHEDGLREGIARRLGMEALLRRIQREYLTPGNGRWEEVDALLTVLPAVADEKGGV